MAAMVAADRAFPAAVAELVMQIRSARLAIRATLSSVLLISLSAHAQGVLIGPSTLNGSFEDGVLTPWFGYGIGVQQDSAFATDGSWYGTLDDSVVFYPLAIQNLRPASTAGPAFSLTLDARAGDPGYSSVSVQMSGRGQSGSISAVITPIAAPPLSSSVWQSYEFLLMMPSAWDAGGVTFSIKFNRSSVDGIFRSGYLDNVVLTQIPEPSPLALVVGTALFALVLGRLRSEAKA